MLGASTRFSVSLFSGYAHVFKLLSVVIVTRPAPAAHDELFSKIVRFPYHVLHSLLPPPTIASENYNLRRRTHTSQLPTHYTLN